MKIQWFRVGMYQTNCFLLTSEDGHCMVVDPGDGDDGVLEYLQKNNIQPERVFVTHGHMDHFADAANLAESYNIPIDFAKKEVGYLFSQEVQRGPYEEEVFEEFLQAVETRGNLLQDGDTIQLGEIKFEILTLPGHSECGACLYTPEEKVIIVGDQLFAGSIGRTDMYRGSSTELIRSIKEKLLVLPEETVVLPGHGPQTTIGAEKKKNPFLAGDMLWEL